VVLQGFNAKPYHAPNPDASIVHFHGPKPHDYVSFLMSGKCEFGDMCQNGLMNAFCLYYLEWYEHVKGYWEDAQPLWIACKTLVSLKLVGN
jgi:hypothetical protein